MTPHEILERAVWHTSVPTLVILAGGSERKRIFGARKRILVAELADILKLDKLATLARPGTGPRTVAFNLGRVPGRGQVDRIVMDFGSVSDLEETMDRTADEIERILSELRTKLHATLASWEGGASEKYRAYQAEWDSAADDLHDTLRRLRRLVRTARGNHSAALHANLSMWQRR